MQDFHIGAEWLLNNEWIFKYLGILAWLSCLVLVKDFIFGIHWARDMLIPLFFISLLVCMFIFI